MPFSGPPGWKVSKKTVRSFDKNTTGETSPKPHSQHSKKHLERAQMQKYWQQAKKTKIKHDHDRAISAWIELFSAVKKLT